MEKWKPITRESFTKNGQDFCRYRTDEKQQALAEWRARGRPLPLPGDLRAWLAGDRDPAAPMMARAWKMPPTRLTHSAEECDTAAEILGLAGYTRLARELFAYAERAKRTEGADAPEEWRV